VFLGIEHISHSEIMREISTAVGLLRIYMFDVELEILLEDTSIKITCQVGLPDMRIPRNVLGRD
jgi:hypothetical protein